MIIESITTYSRESELRLKSLACSRTFPGSVSGSTKTCLMRSRDAWNECEMYERSRSRGEGLKSGSRHLSAIARVISVQDYQTGRNSGFTLPRWCRSSSYRGRQRRRLSQWIKARNGISKYDVLEPTVNQFFVRLSAPRMVESISFRILNSPIENKCCRSDNRTSSYAWACIN